MKSDLKILKNFQFGKGELLSYSDDRFATVGFLGRIIRWLKNIFSKDGFKDCKAAFVAEKIELFLQNNKADLMQTDVQTIENIVSHLRNKQKIKKTQIASTKTQELFIPFILGIGKDNRGRTFNDILAYNDEEKEVHHDYIQWIFPTAKKSAYNSDCPLLTNELIKEIKQNQAILDNLLRAFISMMRFYGFIYDPQKPGILENADNFEERKNKWFKENDHNLQRLTRILNCLSLVGLHKERDALFNKLDSMTNQGAILSTAYTFWRKVARPL